MISCAHPGSMIAFPTEGDLYYEICTACCEFLPLGPAAMSPEAEVELRAAELVALAAGSRYGRFEAFSGEEFDFYVHGDWPAHQPRPSDPRTPGEWAGLLAHIIDHHADQHEETA